MITALFGRWLDFGRMHVKVESDHPRGITLTVAPGDQTSWFTTSLSWEELGSIVDVARQIREEIEEAQREPASGPDR